MTASLPSAATAMGQALLIGFLIGAQREASHGEKHPGVRDFVLIALIGAVCGLLQNPWLTVASLLSVTAMLGVFYFQVKQRAGITTEMAALATYVLGFLTASPDGQIGAPLAIGISIVVVGFLEAKRSLHKLIRETITEAEFDDTLLFLAIVFIVHPILPQGQFGPYQFLDPRRIWMFVILVSSVSYVGYFSEKFMGARRGLKLAALFGGLASTTAATASFARSSSEAPQNCALYAQAAVISNAMQFPRVFLILFLVSRPLAFALALPLGAMTVAGMLAGLWMGRGPLQDSATIQAAGRNPFRLIPALQFGVLFGAILLASKAALALFGSGVLYWTSTLGGSLDVDAVSLSLSDLLARGSLTLQAAALCVLLALLSNAVVKTGIAIYAGTASFARSVAAGFAAMLLAGVAPWLLGRLL